jgi:hypothetical protein
MACAIQPSPAHTYTPHTSHTPLIHTHTHTHIYAKAQPGVIFDKAINFKIKSVHHKVEHLNPQTLNPKPKNLNPRTSRTDTFN